MHRIVVLHSSKRLIRARACVFDVVQDDLRYVPRLVLSVTQVILVFDPCYNSLCLLSCLRSSLVPAIECVAKQSVCKKWLCCTCGCCNICSGLIVVYRRKVGCVLIRSKVCWILLCGSTVINVVFDHVMFAGRSRMFFSPRRLDRLWSQPSSLFDGCRSTLPGVKR